MQQKEAYFQWGGEISGLASADCGKVPKSVKSKEVYPHPNGDNLVLLVIKGPGMMDLVHELYRRAADEA